ncbi:MAG: methyl-accepting chemotaxis protein [Candidatus Endobugula sp.]|jgi:methyl-accepting chemotaxis protein
MLENIATTVNTIREMNAQMATAAEEQSSVSDAMYQNNIAVSAGPKKPLSSQQKVSYALMKSLH